MSIILGLNANHADSSACLIRDGELLFGIEEERINRVKHWAGVPINSIEECLKATGIDSSEITDISLNTNPLSNFSRKSIFFLSNYLLGRKKYEITERIKKKLSIKALINQQSKNYYFGKKTNIHYIDHHISHIASGYYASGFEDAVGLSIDGFGDFCSLSIAKCRLDNIKILKKIYFPHSLGIFYEAITQLLGFQNYGDEYKVMGLSSYGNPQFFDLIKKNIFKESSLFCLNTKYFNHINKNFEYKYLNEPKQNKIFNDEIFKLFKKGELQNYRNFSKYKADIACSAQRIFEYFLKKICEVVKKTNISKNLVYVGGCALNSSANNQILINNYFEKVFIPYAPGDAGGSIGSALVTFRKENKKKNFKNLTTPFIGSAYSNKYIEIIINNDTRLKKFKVNFFNDKLKLNKIVAKKIFDDQIIGIFNSRMEFGARALGNRSILANPCSPNIKEIINKKIKRRESFRPFAPSILLEEKINWFGNSCYNPYMSCVEKINDNKKNLIPGVTHVDGTGRVQTVTKEFNEDFYNLIKSFHKISGVPILLNTSFNENEPIVRMPEEAINCFLRTEMDALVLENFLIERTKYI
jgi:carbamoyltransferase